MLNMYRTTMDSTDAALTTSLTVINGIWTLIINYKFANKCQMAWSDLVVLLHVYQVSRIGLIDY